MTSPETLLRNIRLATGCGLITMVTGALLLVFLKTAEPSAWLFVLIFVAKISFAAGLFSLASVDFSLKKNTRLDTPALRSRMRVAFIILLLNIPLGIGVMKTALTPKKEPATEQKP